MIFHIMADLTDSGLVALKFAVIVMENRDVFLLHICLYRIRKMRGETDYVKNLDSSQIPERNIERLSSSPESVLQPSAPYF